MDNSSIGTSVPTYSTQFVPGNLYQIASAKTDIRRTFFEKCGWVGPEELRRIKELSDKGGDL